jgi:hypothetical protein
MTRELEKYGAASSCIAGREHIAYVVEGTCLQTAEVTEILMDAALNQRWVLGGALWGRGVCFFGGGREARWVQVSGCRS